MTRKREHKVFSNLLKNDPTQARAYREECLGLDKDDNKVGISKEDKKVETVKTTPAINKDAELKNEYRKLLKNEEIEFHPSLGIKKLREKCVEAGLLN